MNGNVLELAALNGEVGKAVEIWSPTVTHCCLLAASMVPLTTYKAHLQIADNKSSMASVSVIKVSKGRRQLCF